MKYLLASFLFLFGLTRLTAQQPYPHLKTFQIANEYCGDEPYFKIHYNETLAETINTKRNELPEDHPLFATDSFEEHDIVVLKLKFNSKQLSEEYFLVFSHGPSCDPGFYFTDTNKKSIGSASGMEIYIPGGNSVYTSGHINTTFNKRRKYALTEGKFQEVKPEFYYVGLKTKTLKPVTLYADEELTTQLASLPADYNVEVVAAKRTTDYASNIKYLIKTEVGLLGWSTIETAAFRSLQIEGIMFLGD